MHPKQIVIFCCGLQCCSLLSNIMGNIALQCIKTAIDGLKKTKQCFNFIVNQKEDTGYYN